LRSDAIKIVKLSIRPIGRRQRRSSPLPHVDTSPKRRRAVLWLLANFVAWRLQQRDRTTKQDYYDFLRRAKWKSQEATWWDERVGNYLSVFMKEPPTRDRANLTPPKDGQRNVGPQAANR